MKIYEFELVPMCVGETDCIVGNKAERIVSYMKGAFDKHPAQEQIWVLFLNRKNNIMGRHMITLGTATAALAHPREVLRAVILASATAFVIVHNHPSGDPAPSAPDIHVTRLLREASKAIDIPMLDHVIIGDAEFDPAHRGFYSFADAGMI